MAVIEIIQGDITHQSVDAIVNAANCSLLGGGGGRWRDHRAAGPEPLAECRTPQRRETGKAKITGGYRLPAKHVIHTPGPVWHGGAHGEDESLASCYRSCCCSRRKTAARLSISVDKHGVYHFPLDRAAKIAISTIIAVTAAHPEIERVRMVCFDSRTKQAYENAAARGARMKRLVRRAI